ncbi:outer membrane protein [Duganella sp. 1411]|uniref:MipA/OmpV family protein n=1 Tax=Duganella sp. 1411 TaxID=2806572 RepID=UPI001AE3A2A8|nr:MipA/OmpV family protein [Duganella sp. 1411]MBP1204222.1 outer membrane protein [Duganella sp. 1411]
MSQLQNTSPIRLPSLHGWLSAIALAAVAAAPAFAQSQAEPGRPAWAVGAGAALIDKPYRDVDRETRALPVIAYENKWVVVGLPTADVKLFSTDAVSIRLRARYAGDGYEAGDAPVLAGMEKRKGSLWGGGALIWKTGVANLSAELLADTMGNSKGTRARAQVDRRFAAGKFGLTPRLAVEWVDDKYVDYYYGVRRSEATASRAFYEGKATTVVHAGLRADYTLFNRHTIFTDLNVSRFGSAVKDSPLVDKPNQTLVAVGYIYRF